jgi:ribosomal protein S27E
MSKKLNIEDIRKIVEATGSKLISIDYKYNHDKLDVICPNGHLYHPTTKSIKRGNGCSICYNSTENRKAVKAHPEKINEAIKIAEKHGGKCLSEKYENNREKLEFQCKNNHRWKTSFKSVLTGAWCPECSTHSITENKRNEKIKLAFDIAKSYGGDIIDYDKNSIGKKITWKCAGNHIWQATFQNVVYNYSWCPYCKSSFSENICRQYLENLFNEKFPRIRPKWLLSDKNAIMELDGYCEKLNLAFEHQGLQHYEKIDYFNSEETQKRDKIKQKLCELNNVKILYIPALFYLTTIELFHLTIGDLLEKLNIIFDKNKLKPLLEVVDLRGAKTIDSKIELEKIKKLAKEHGGECLSSIYTGHNCRMQFRCAEGHIWTSGIASIKQGHWCLQCSNKTNITVIEIKTISNSKNIEFLNDSYIRNSDYLDFRCKQCGNEWKSTYNNLQYRKGCPICSRKAGSEKRKKDISVYQEAAIKKGGKCISIEINSCFEKLEWECGAGHRWLGRADQIKNTKKWCPICYKENIKKK